MDPSISVNAGDPRLGRPSVATDDALRASAIADESEREPIRRSHGRTSSRASVSGARAETLALDESSGDAGLPVAAAACSPTAQAGAAAACSGSSASSRSRTALFGVRGQERLDHEVRGRDVEWRSEGPARRCLGSARSVRLALLCDRRAAAR
jgi:hypothetical protein